MRAFLFAAAALGLTQVAFAKSWNGITPGASTRGEVVKKFGEPSKKVDQEGKTILAYTGEQAIKGTTQAQFVALADGVIEQIVVFPATAIDKATVEDSFGPACTPAGGQSPPAPAAAASCYVKKLSDDFRTYFWYKRQGLVVFFTEDGKSVYSFVYNAPGAGEKKGG